MLHERRLDDLGVGAERADSERVAVDANTAQFLQPP